MDRIEEKTGFEERADFKEERPFKRREGGLSFTVKILILLAIIPIATLLYKVTETMYNNWMIKRELQALEEMFKPQPKPSAKPQPKQAVKPQPKPQAKPEDTIKQSIDLNMESVKQLHGDLTKALQDELIPKLHATNPNLAREKEQESIHQNDDGVWTNIKKEGFYQDADGVWRNH